MDDYSGKKTVTGVGFGRRGSSFAFRDNREDTSIQYCNQLGCSTQLNSMRGTQIGKPEKLKLSRPSFCSTSSKATVGSSSRPFSSLSDHRRSKREQRNTISLQETITVESSSRREQIEENFESSSRQEEIVNLESNPTTTGIQKVLAESEDLESAIHQGFSINVTELSGSCTVTSNPKLPKPINRRTVSDNQETYSSSSVRRSVTSRNATQVMKPVSQGQGTNAQRCGLRNLSCTLISDILPSGCSSSEVGRNRRTDALRKRYPDGESSSVRGKGISGSSNVGNSGSPKSGLSCPSSSLLERPLPQPVSRTRNWPTSRDGVVSVRTRRSTSGDGRMKPSEHGDDNTFLPPEPLMIPPLPQTQFSIGEATTASSSRSFSTELTPICQNFFGRSGSSNGSGRSRAVAHSEDGSSRVFHDSLVDRDVYQRFNMEGIAEVLLALERIEQDEELTYEQLMVLETNLFLDGIGFHDQHRDMRLDIDNMSYEELLTLEEKMGTVSTALTDEALSKCLKRSIFMPTSSALGITGFGGDDVKCSICQEDYVFGDEVGKLGCEHRYHLTCIHRWLQQKNRCPICKASAEESQVLCK